MLKIKDNVDLKELEKFGFEEDYCVDEKTYSKKFLLGSAYGEEIIIWTSTKEIQIINGIRLLTTIYDLIKADLVEKVED